MSHAELIEKLKAQLLESYELTKKSRKEAEKALRYYHGKQLPDDVIAILNGRGQPEMWENMVDKIASKIMGLKSKVNTEISAVGRQRADAALGAVVTDTLRAFQDNEVYELSKEQSDEDLLIYGLHVREVHLNVTPRTDAYGRYEKEITITRGDPREYYYDPYSKDQTYADGRYMHRIFWIDRDRLYEYFDAEKVDMLIESADFSPMGANWEESYKQNTYGASRERVMVCYSWYKEFDRKAKITKIKYAIWSGDIMLDSSESPHSNGKFPFVFRRYRIGDEVGEFYGIMRNVIPLQDAINFGHLRVANLQGSVKLIIEKGVTDNHQGFAAEYSKDDAVVFVKDGAISSGRFKEIRNESKIPALMARIRELKQAAQEVVGLNDEAAGAAVNRLSGYAIDKRLDIGITSVDKFMKTSLNSDKEGMRIAVDFVQQYFDAEQEYRISDAITADRYFVINEVARDENGVIIQNGEVTRKNNIAVGRYDLTLKAVPQTSGSRAERAEQNIETMKVLERVMPQAVPEIAIEVINDQNPAVGAKVEKIVAAYMAQPQGEDPTAKMMEQKVQMDLAAQAAKIEQTQVKTAKIASEMGMG